MATFYGISESDLDAIAEEAQRQFENAAAMRERLDDLVGRAESRDGRLSMGVSQRGEVVELEIDPRAMRMGSQELAEALRELSREAADDLRRQSHETAEGQLDDDGKDLLKALEDPESVKEQMAAMQDTFRRAVADSMNVLDDLRQRLGR